MFGVNTHCLVYKRECVAGDCSKVTLATSALCLLPLGFTKSRRSVDKAPWCDVSLTSLPSLRGTFACAFYGAALGGRRGGGDRVKNLS